MIIGVLALQGAFLEHQRVLEKCGVQTVLVRKPEQLARVDGLIIPGGESTTIGKLMRQFGLDEEIRAKAKAGMPVFGTCAGMIVLAAEIENSDQFRLALMDMEVARNAFGRQVDSFETEIVVPTIGEPGVRGVFIRAPYVKSVGPEVQILGEYQGKIVMARQGNLLVAAFHPELTEDARVHQYFLDMVRDQLRN